MNTLTDKERNGLEDIFLSIHKNKKRDGSDGLLSSSMTLNYHLKYKKIIQKRSKLHKLVQFFTKNRQKKKNLSK